jgi:hypothetical protein
MSRPAAMPSTTCCGKPGLGGEVHRRLVLVAPPDLRAHLVVFEDLAEERHLGDQAGEAEIARRLQPDLVERGGEIIGLGTGAEFAEALGKGDGELVRRPERLHRIAQFLCLPVAKGARRAKLGDQALDPLVAAGASQCLDDLQQGRLRAPGEAQQRGAAARLGNPALQVQLQHRAVRDRRLLGPEHQPCPDAAGHEQHHENADHRKDAAEEPTHAREPPVRAAAAPAASRTPSSTGHTGPSLAYRWATGECAPRARRGPRQIGRPRSRSRADQRWAGRGITSLGRPAPP